MAGIGGMAGSFMAGSIVAKLLLDKTGWNQSVKSLKKDETEIGGRLTALGNKFTSFGKNMTRAVTLPLLAIGGGMVKMAMDAVESENLFEVSMGNMAKAARDWSVELSKSLGLNQYETRKTIGMFNVMMSSMGQGEQAAYDMAKGLTQLGYDMASFYNMRPDEAFLKLQAAISGEVEPLKRLGIIVNETTIKQWAMTNGMIRQGQTMTEVQKVTARYNVILEMTKAAQGDLARTIDSPANKLRLLKSRIQETSTELGVKLLPTFMSFITQVQSAVEWFSKLSDGTKDTIVKLGMLLAALGPLNIALGAMLRTTAALHLSLGKVTLAFAAAGAAFAAATWLRKNAFKDHSDEVDAITQKWDILINQVGGGWTNIAQAAARAQKQILGEVKFSLEDLNAVWDKYGQISRKAFEAIISGGEGEELKKLFMGLYGEKLKLSGIMETLTGQAGAQTGVLGGLGQGIRGVGDAVSGALIPFLELSEAVSTLDWNLDRLAKKITQWDDVDFLTNVVEIPVELDLDNLAPQTDEAIGILTAFQEEAAALSAQATEDARAPLEAMRALSTQIFADIINGFTSIMDGSRAMGEMFSGIVTKMIADLGKLVIAEIMMAKKSILADQMRAVASAIASIFKSLPWFLAIPAAAGAFGLVSRLFSKLLKFKEGGVFTEPTIAEIGHGTEYVLPEKKLISLVRDAMAMPAFTGAPAMAFAGAGGGGGATVTVNMNAPLISTTGLSRRDMEEAGEEMARIVDFHLRRRVGRG